MTSWLDDPTHREWLGRGLSDVLGFALRSIRPEGGFHHLDADGTPLQDHPPMLFLTARMAYSASAGVRHGVPGSGELLDHAMASTQEAGTPEWT